MIGEIVIPTDVNFAKRHEPSGAVVARRIAGTDDAREISKATDSERRQTHRAAVSGAKLGAGIVGTKRAVEVGAFETATNSYRHELPGSARTVVHGVHVARGAGKGALIGGGAAALVNVANRGRHSQRIGKGLLAPTNQGPVKKAPTLANTGGQQHPRKGLLMRTAQIADDPVRMAARAVTKADGRAQRRGAGKGAAVGAGVTTAGGAAIGNAYHGATAERRRARGKAVTRAGDITSGARSMWRPSVVRDLHGVTLAPVAIGAGVGALRAANRRSVTKAHRSFDPEDARQRRLGAMASAAGLGGGALAYQGGRSVQRATRTLTAATRNADKLDEGVASSKYGRSLIAVKNAAEGSAVVPRKAAGKIGGGALLLTGAARLMSDRHKKAWR